MRRSRSPGLTAFAVTFIGLGAMGFTTGEFQQIWLPVPKWVPGQPVIAYLVAALSLGAGIGLLVRAAAPVASRALLVALGLWLLAMRVPNLLYEKPLVLVAWSWGATAVMLAGAWVLHDRLHEVRDARGRRIARILFGLALIPFGLAHFMYVEATAPLIPDWLPAHVALAYLTGAAFIAAGLSAITGILARVGVALAALQMGLFSLIVWMPRMFRGDLSDFQRGEVISTIALTAGAWAVAESYSDEPTRPSLMP